jgi:hypothetical protein
MARGSQANSIATEFDLLKKYVYRTKVIVSSKSGNFKSPFWFLAFYVDGQSFDVNHSGRV